MNSILFEERVWQLDGEFLTHTHTHKKALIINCPTKSTIGNFSKIRLTLFPPNTTSVPQSIDQGYCWHITILLTYYNRWTNKWQKISRLSAVGKWGNEYDGIEIFDDPVGRSDSFEVKNALKWCQKLCIFNKKGNEWHERYFATIQITTYPI